MPNVQAFSGVWIDNGIWGFKMAKGLNYITSISFKIVEWLDALVNFIIFFLLNYNLILTSSWSQSSFPCRCFKSTREDMSNLPFNYFSSPRLHLPIYANKQNTNDSFLSMMMFLRKKARAVWVYLARLLIWENAYMLLYWETQLLKERSGNETSKELKWFINSI